MKAEDAYFVIMSEIIQKIELHKKVMKETKNPEVKERAYGMESACSSILREMKELIQK